MQKVLGYVLISVLLVTVAGCRFGPVKPRGGADDSGTDQMLGDEQRYAGDLGAGPDMQAMNDPANPLSKRVLYFELDSSQISSEDQEVIAAHARYLSANPKISVILEGHADERGTREYNLALGERRAKAAQRLLQVQGVQPQQIQVISFGEERPVALDHNESAWRLNRRVEILYSGY